MKNTTKMSYGGDHSVDDFDALAIRDEEEKMGLMVAVEEINGFR